MFSFLRNVFRFQPHLEDGPVEADLVEVPVQPDLIDFGIRPRLRRTTPVPSDWYHRQREAERKADARLAEREYQERIDQDRREAQQRRLDELDKREQYEIQALQGRLNMAAANRVRAEHGLAPTYQIVKQKMKSIEKTVDQLVETLGNRGEVMYEDIAVATGFGVKSRRFADLLIRLRTMLEDDGYAIEYTPVGFRYESQRA